VSECVVDSALTSSTDQDTSTLIQFAVRGTPTKLERSSEKVRPTVRKPPVTQTKSRSLDTAARKQEQPAVDADDVGKGSRQNLKLVMDKVSHF